MSDKWGVSWKDNGDGTVHVTGYKGGATGGGRVSGDLNIQTQSFTGIHASRQDDGRHSNNPEEWREGGGFFDGCFGMFLLMMGSGALLVGMLIKVIT